MALLGGELDTVVMLITAAGALGTSAAGIVETLKGYGGWGGAIGLKFDLTEADLRATLGETGVAFLVESYGPQAMALVRGSHRSGGDSLEVLLRAGLRLALREGNASRLRDWLALEKSGVTEEDLAALARAIAEQEAPTGVTSEPASDVAPASAPSAPEMRTASRMRRVLGEIELRIDALVTATVASATERYRARMKWYAGLLSLGIGLLVGVALAQADGATFWLTLGQGALVGLIAVPVAPIAKDLTSTIGALRDALSRRTA